MIAGLSYYKGLVVGNVSIVSPVGSSYPILTVILSVLFLGENLTSLQIAAIAFAIVGSILVSFRLKDLMKLSTKRVARGVDYAVLAALSWGFMMLFIGILAKELGWYLPILLINLLELFYLLSYSKFHKKNISLPVRSIIILIVLSASLGVISSLSYSVGTTVAYISIVATVSSVYPAITIMLARFFFKERLDVNQWFGVLLVLLGLVLLSM